MLNIENLNCPNFQRKNVKIDGVMIWKRRSTSKRISDALNSNKEMQKYFDNNNTTTIIEYKNKTTFSKQSVISAEFINLIRKIHNFIEMYLGSGNIVYQQPLINIGKMMRVYIVEKNRKNNTRTFIAGSRANNFDTCLTQILDSIKQLTPDKYKEMKSIQHGK